METCNLDDCLQDKAIHKAINAMEALSSLSKVVDELESHKDIQKTRADNERKWAGYSGRCAYMSGQADAFSLAAYWIRQFQEYHAVTEN